jgi:hypothetical protein
LFRTKKISGQENTQPLKVDTMVKDKGQMINNDLLNTTGKKQNKQSKRLINANPTKT